MSIETETAVKAAESLADWSKWVVTLQTAAIAAVPYILGATDADKKIAAWQNFNWSLKTCLCCYLVSILAGTIVLGNVPIALTKLANGQCTQFNVHDEDAIPFGWLGAKVWHFSGIEHFFFFAGTIMLVIHLWNKN